MTSEPDVRGALEPKGPEWWIASDGRYYPPELSPDSPETPDAPSAPGDSPSARPKTVEKKAKKKVKKKVKKVKKKAKKAATPKTAAAGAGPAARQSPRPAAKPSPAPDVPEGNAGDNAESSAEEDDEALVDITDRREGQQKFLARAPGTDQIAARQIQAKEQAALLAGARMEAALRLLSDEPDAQLMPAGAGASIGANAVSTMTGPDALRSPSAPETSTPGTYPTTERPVVEATLAVPETSSTPDLPEPPDLPGPPNAAHAPGQAGAAVADDGPSDAIPAPIGLDKPFMEVKGSALGTDIERIRERLLIFADRVELHDGSGNVLQTIRYDHLADVEIHRKLLGPTLLIRSESGSEITAKALRPELATGAKAMIEKHAERSRSAGPAGHTATTTGTSPRSSAAFRDRTDRPELAAMLDELHQAGILTEAELADKLSLLEGDARP